MSYMPDYGLILAAEQVIDGANSHAIRQELNAYQLCVRALNESLPSDERSQIETMCQRTETNLRIIVTRARLSSYLI